MQRLRPAAWAAILLLFSTSTARAQQAGPVGVRAAGMGGAFTAVADDASATFWNPAGLASGAYFSAVVDGNTLRTAGDADPGHRRSGLLVSFAMPALGLSYYRTRVTGAIAQDAGGRNTGGRLGATLVTDQAGVTLVQSLDSRFAVGATLKIVHGVTSGLSSVADHSSTTVDADIGVMAVGSAGRLGLTVRNAREPGFATGQADDVVALQRQVRAGGVLRIVRGTMLAVDADLTRTDSVRGPWRDAAVGVEVPVATVGTARGGVHWNTAGSALGTAPIASIGGSYAVRGALMADAQVSFGSARGDRGWGVGIRFSY